MLAIGMKNNIHIKSKKRVADHGEVFTHEREVNAMLDLVKQETERIDSRFLEPACGSGNFLAEVLQRKLNIVTKKYKKIQLEFERYAVLAISSIYGVELLPDNAQECRDRLLGIFTRVYENIYKNKINGEVINSADYLLSKNIICGDAITLLDNKGEPIVFSEWSAVNGNQLKRRDYTLSHLLECAPHDNFCLFSEAKEDIYNPKPVAEFPLVNFLKIDQYE